MDVFLGGGSIEVDPGTLGTLSARVGGAGRETNSARASLGASAGAASGCQDPASAAYTRLHTLLRGAIGLLGESAGTVARNVTVASSDYTGTDAAVMPAVGGPDAG